MADIEVRVLVVPNTEKSTDGRVDTGVPLEQLRSDICKELGLGEPADWDIALVPNSVKVTLSSYRPSDDDALMLVRRSESRGSSFKPNK